MEGVLREAKRNSPLPTGLGGSARLAGHRSRGGAEGRFGEGAGAGGQLGEGCAKHFGGKVLSQLAESWGNRMLFKVMVVAGSRNR